MGYLADSLLLGFLLLQTWLGCRSGLLWQATGMAALAFGVLLGTALAPALGGWLQGHLTADPFHAQVIAFLFVAGLVGLCLRLLATWAEVAADRGVGGRERERRRAHDRVLGGIFGALKALVLAMVLLASARSLAPAFCAWKTARLSTPLAAAGARLLPARAVEDAAAWVDASTERLKEGLQIRTARREKRLPSGASAAVPEP